MTPNRFQFMMLSSKQAEGKKNNQKNRKGISVGGSMLDWSAFLLGGWSILMNKDTIYPENFASG